MRKVMEKIIIEEFEMNQKNSFESFYDSADKVEHAFYKAFGEGDIQLMNSIFADENVSYTHPGSPTIVGRKNVMDYWEFILTGIEQTTVNSKVLNKVRSHNIEMHLVSETFEITGQGGKLSETITSNFYIKQKNGWRLQMQHSSASDVVGDIVAPNFDEMMMSACVSQTIN